MGGKVERVLWRFLLLLWSIAAYCSDQIFFPKIFGETFLNFSVSFQQMGRKICELYARTAGFILHPAYRTKQMCLSSAWWEWHDVLNSTTALRSTSRFCLCKTKANTRALEENASLKSCASSAVIEGVARRPFSCDEEQTAFSEWRRTCNRADSSLQPEEQGRAAELFLLRG